MSAPSIPEQIASIMVGSVSLSINKSIFAPIDRVKLVLQLQGGFLANETFPKYRGIFKTLRSLVHEQGFASLWRGNFAHILIYFPTQMANLALLYSINPLVSILIDNNRQDKFMNSLIYSLVGTVIPLAASHPFQIVWTKLATDMSPAKQNTSMINLLKDIYSSTGFKSFYNGFYTLILGKLLFKPLQISLYYGLHDKVLNNDSFFTSFLFSQAITIFTGLMVYPLDTISRRLMLQAGSEQALSAFGMIKQIFINEGKIFGFYRGWMCILLSSFINAGFLAVYDSFRR